MFIARIHSIHSWLAKICPLPCRGTWFESQAPGSHVAAHEDLRSKSPAANLRAESESAVSAAAARRDPWD